MDTNDLPQLHAIRAAEPRDQNAALHGATFRKTDYFAARDDQVIKYANVQQRERRFL